MNLFSKFLFLLKRPQVIIVTGNGRACAAQALFQVLRQHFKVKKITKFPQELQFRHILRNEILILETELLNFSAPAEKFNFLFKKSKLPILLITHLGEIPPDKTFFAAPKEKSREIINLTKILPPQGYLILNFDDETVREINDLTNAFTLSFGFQEKADLRASDIHINSGTNFKINYQGNIVPIWLENLFGKEQIYSALAAASVGVIFDINLVEISQALKNYNGLAGKMRLIEGIKHSLILDDSESASVFSMIEALEILGKIKAQRKIAVLGDILGIGKYTIEAHESIGERVAKAADLLFTVGPRAKFIAQGVKARGFSEEKIFQFDDVAPAGKTLQDEIKEGDIILVDGSKEMKMGKIIEEIKAY